MTVKDLIEALNQCHPDAEIFFSVDPEGKGELVTVEHELMWRREKGDNVHPGLVLLHNDASHFFNQDGSQANCNFVLT